MTRNYGQLLLESLPPARQIHGEWPELRRLLRKFYRTGRVAVVR
ncbi:MAG: hypothetical protein MNPFHGCM_01752 [Gemmatimonadaceae bacterium]|nr:hypothetical protein [Gemmatimonadaceae bacterium]